MLHQTLLGREAQAGLDEAEIDSGRFCLLGGVHTETIHVLGQVASLTFLSSAAIGGVETWQ